MEKGSLDKKKIIIEELYDSTVVSLPKTAKNLLFNLYV